MIWLTSGDQMVHELAVVHEDCKLGNRVKVWQFASVIRGSIIGDDTSISANAKVDCSDVGKRCKILDGAQIHPGMSIGDDVFVGPGVIFCNDIWPRAARGTFALEDIIQRDVIITEVGNGASLGARAVVMPGVKIGEGAMVAAAAVVRRDLAAHHLLDRFGITHLIEDESKITRVRSVHRDVSVAAE